MLERQLDAGNHKITPAIVTQFGEILRSKLCGPDPKLRHEYVRLLVDRVEVGDRNIRISGPNSALQRALIASQTPGGMVPKAERKWRARLDSNQRPLA